VDCLINNLNDAVAWGHFLILLSTHDLSLTQIGLLGALYPAFGALRSSAPTIGHKWLIARACWFKPAPWDSWPAAPATARGSSRSCCSR
jgi:hypothetical protein